MHFTSRIRRKTANIKIFTIFINLMTSRIYFKIQRQNSKALVITYKAVLHNSSNNLRFCRGISNNIKGHL